MAFDERMLNGMMGNPLPLRTWHDPHIPAFSFASRRLANICWRKGN